MDTSEPPMDHRRRHELEETIRQAVRELLVLEGAAGIIFPLDERTQISVGNMQQKPKIRFDTPKRCVVVDGKECYTPEELWKIAWEAQRAAQNRAI